MRFHLLASLVLATTPLFADQDDDTLRLYLSKSELVIACEIIEEPIGITSEGDVVRYHCKIKLIKVMKGQKPTDDTLEVSVGRFEFGKEDRLPFLKNGSRCILFLKRRENSAVPGWVSADMWFGAQPFSASMITHLERVQKASVSK